jgi:hypothetical protein
VHNFISEFKKCSKFKVIGLVVAGKRFGQIHVGRRGYWLMKKDRKNIKKKRSRNNTSPDLGDLKNM